MTALQDWPIYVNTTVSNTNTYGNWSMWAHWLSEVSYKPGWSFELRDYGYPYTNHVTMNGTSTFYPGLSLLVTAKVIDSNTLGDTLITHTMPLDTRYVYTREEFLAEVLRCVKMIEIHECMEFLKALGERVKNPHPSPTTVLYE